MRLEIGRAMSPSAAPELRFVFRIVAEVGSYLPLQQRDAELLEFIPITGGRLRSAGLTRGSTIGAA